MSGEWGVDRVRGGGAPARKRPTVRGKTGEAGGSDETVYLPRKVQLEMSQQNMRLDVALKEVKVNRFALICAEVCRTCEKDCAALDGMEDCVQACRECARLSTEISRLEHAEILKTASQTAPGPSVN